MIQPDPAPQTPPAKVLLLGLALILLPLLCLFFLGPGAVATILVIALLLMGAAIVWQGVRNLKRG